MSAFQFRTPATWLDSFKAGDVLSRRPVYAIDEHTVGRSSGRGTRPIVGRLMALVLDPSTDNPAFAIVSVKPAMMRVATEPKP